MDELEQIERGLLTALSNADLNAASALLHDDFLITTAGWIAEPVGKEAWLGSFSERMWLDAFDLRVLATQRLGNVVVVLVQLEQEGTHDGEHFSLTFRYTDVCTWRRRLGTHDPACVHRPARVAGPPRERHAAWMWRSCV